MAARAAALDAQQRRGRYIGVEHAVGCPIGIRLDLHVKCQLDANQHTIIIIIIRFIMKKSAQKKTN